MASQYTFKNRVSHHGMVHTFKPAAVTVVDSTTTLHTVDLPPGEYAVTVVVLSSGSTDNTITLKINPYVDSAQSTIGAAYGFVLPGSSTCVTFSAVAAGAATSVVAHLVGSAGSNMSVNLPVVIPYGLRIGTTTNAGAGAAVGTYSVAVVAVEG